jgi:hypothetical protein
MANPSLIGWGYGNGAGFGNSSTRFTSLANCLNTLPADTEANLQVPLKAGTLSNARIYNTAANANGTFTAHSRIAGVNGNLVITIAPSTTGETEDVTHSDSVTDGQLVCQSIVTTASGSSWTVTSFTFEYDATVAVSAVYGNYQASYSDSSTPTLYSRGLSVTTNTATLGTEADAQVLLRAAGTISELTAQVTANAGGQPTTVIVTRLSGVSGAGTLSYAGGTTGLQTDGTHSDSVSAGNLFCYQHDTGGVTRTVTYHNESVLFVSSAAGFDTNHGYGSNSGTQNGVTTITFLAPNSRSVNATEANVQSRFRFAQTFSNLRIYLQTNTGGNTVTSTFRDGGVTGASSAASTSGGTGRFEDSTHTDSIASGDLVTLSHIGSASTGYIIMNVAGTLGAPNISINLTGVSATGSANAPVVSPSINVTGASATGSADAVVPEIDAAAVSATATGAAADPGVSIQGSPMAGVSATGAAADTTLLIDNNPGAPQASATGAAGAVTPSIAVAITGVEAAGSAQDGTPKIPAQTDLPVKRLMRNTPVPAIGTMSNTAVALVGKLRASGPEPKGVAVNITGVFARGVVINVTPSRRVLVPAVSALATCTANDVTVTIS